MSDRRTTLLATAALLAMTACWGSTFFLISDTHSDLDLCGPPSAPLGG